LLAVSGQNFPLRWKLAALRACDTGRFGATRTRRVAASPRAVVSSPRRPDALILGKSLRDD
jgi:hypothetical protein